MVNLNSLSIEDRNRIKLKMAGILPGYINCSGGAAGARMSEIKDRVPFSTHYRTHQEYIRDQETIAEMACNGLEIPDEIVKKLQLTNEELGI